MCYVYSDMSCHVWPLVALYIKLVSCTNVMLTNYINILLHFVARNTYAVGSVSIAFSVCPDLCTFKHTVTNHRQHMHSRGRIHMLTCVTFFQLIIYIHKFQKQVFHLITTLIVIHPLRLQYVILN